MLTVYCMTHMPSPTYADLKLTVTLLSLISVKLSESLSSVIPSPFSQITAVLKEWERASDVRESEKERKRTRVCVVCVSVWKSEWGRERRKLQNLSRFSRRLVIPLDACAALTWVACWRVSARALLSSCTLPSLYEWRVIRQHSFKSRDRFVPVLSSQVWQIQSIHIQ